MRNLKRALSLALAAVMLIGMMVVGASAASYNDFTDRDEIVNKDAVSMLTTLGVIDGKTDGSFDPEGTVRRDEMAKMISVIMNQGVDNNDLFSGVNSKLTDIGDNWAKGHINYCFTLGIIAGRGDGRFDPAANVTGAEAAKMLLVAAGYDPAIEGFVGTDWAINTNAKASSLGIFRNFNKNIMNPLSRDDAALLIYNALDVEMIQKYENGYAIGYTDHRTILSAMYGVYKVEGVVVANEWAELDQTDSDAALKAGKTTLDNVVLYSSTTANTTTGEGVAQSGQIAFNVSTGVETLGKTVTLYIEKTTILSDSKVLGVSLKDSVNVIEATDATKSTVKGFLKGTGLTTTKDTEYYVNYGYCADADVAVKAINEAGNLQLTANNLANFNLNGVEVEVIDNNNDGDVDYVLYRVQTLSEVMKYSEKNEVIGLAMPKYAADGSMQNSASTVSLDFADVVFEDDAVVATDDLVLYIQYGGRTYISEPEIVTGKMTRVDRDSAKELYITVEGETYKQSYIPDAAAMVDVDVEHFDIEVFRNFSDTYDFILDSTGKYVVAVRPAEEVVTNYALVIGSAWTQNALEVRGQVKILKADGTEGTYYINWANSAKVFADLAAAINKANPDDPKITKTDLLEDYLGSRDVLYNNNNNTVNAAAGTVITYTLSDDDVLTIRGILNHNDYKDDGLTLETGLGKDVDVSTLPVSYIAYNHAAKDSVAGTGFHKEAEKDGKSNLQYLLANDYDAGDGYVTVKNAAGDAKNATYAIDKNTLAFYYVDEDDYGVATGWDHMGSLKAANNVGVQVYPVLQKDTDKTLKATKLADVVLFGAAPETEAADWLLVLSANALSSKVLELNVVFEDGTAKAIEVSREDYEDDFDTADDFMSAYKYSVNSDGTYKINVDDPVKATTAKLLKDGTLDVANLVDIYPTITGKSNVWDVTDMSDASEGSAPAGTFTYNESKNVVVVYTNASKVAVDTAWVWDVEAEKPTDKEVTDYALSIAIGAYNEGKLVTPVTASLTKYDTETKTWVKADAGMKLDYTYKVELMAANGSWVESLTGNGSDTTDGEGEIVVNIPFNSARNTNAYRITVTASNAAMGGSVSDVQLGG